MKDFFNKLQDKILIIDYSGKILFCNNILLNQLQYKLENLDNVYDLIINPKIRFDTIDINYNKEYIVNILAKNGSSIPFRLDLSYTTFNNSDNILILLTDIAPKHLLSENLEETFKFRTNTEKELSFLLKTATDITSIMSIDGSFIKINDGWYNVLGYTLSDLAFKNWYDVIHENDLDMIKSLINNSIVSESISEACTRVIDKNNNIKWIHWSFSYIEKENIIITTGRDITEEKKLEIEKKLIEEALQVESIKNEFFANISHEFKTPLNIILASLQIIRQNLTNNNIIISDSFNFDKYISSIKQNSYRLLRLANNLIDITKIDTGHYEIHKKNCNIISIIEDITLSVAQYVNDKNIELLFDTSIEELIICCDPDKIERIMLNLLSNAIKYTNSNGCINVNIDITDTDVIISVKDTGIGISKENQSIIFERFMQVDDTLTRKCEGSGIGLSLVKSLVEMHGGKIAVYSVENVGSEFTFTLPKTVIPNSKIIYTLDDTSHSKVEKCNIEFSDIYVI